MQITEDRNISHRDIHAIIKEEEARRLRHKDQQQQEEISSKAYKLFTEGKKPVDIAIALNLREPEVIKIFIEYCRLKRLHKFYLAYRELGDEGIGDFLKLCKLAKKEGYSRQQVVKLLQLVDEDNYIGLSSFEKGRKWRIDEIHELDMQIEKSKKHLQSVNDEIASANTLLNFYHMLYERKRQELENINSEALRIVTLVNRFKSDNEEYLKIEKTVEEKVKSVLTDNKQILQFALASVIEAIRRNSDKYNSPIFNDTSTSSTLTSIPAQGSILSHIEDYRDMILEEAKRLYDSLLHHFTNSIIDNAVFKMMPLPSILPRTYISRTNSKI